MHFAFSRNCRYEWRSDFPTNPPHFLDGNGERCSHVAAGQVAGGKDELTHPIFLKRALLEKVVANVLVSRQQDPPVPPDFRQPSFVRSSARKMVKMAFETNSRLLQRFLEGPGIT